MRKFIHKLVHKPVVSVFTTIDIIGAIYLTAGVVATVAVCMMGGCLPSIAAERVPGTLIYRAEGLKHYPLCMDTIEVLAQRMDGLEFAADVREASRIVNGFVGRDVFKFAGVTDVDLDNPRRPFAGEFVIVSNMSPMSEQKIKKNRKAGDGNTVCGAATQSSINGGLEIYITSDNAVHKWDPLKSRIKKGRCCFSGVVQYDDDCGRGRMRVATMVHELLHIMGLWHSTESRTIMRKVVDDATVYRLDIGDDSWERIKELYPEAKR